MCKDVIQSTMSLRLCILLHLKMQKNKGKLIRYSTRVQSYWHIGPPVPFVHNMAAQLVGWGIDTRSTLTALRFSKPSEFTAAYWIPEYRICLHDCLLRKSYDDLHFSYKWILFPFLFPWIFLKVSLKFLSVRFWLKPLCLHMFHIEYMTKFKTFFIISYDTKEVRSGRELNPRPDFTRGL